MKFFKEHRKPVLVVIMLLVMAILTTVITLSVIGNKPYIEEIVSFGAFSNDSMSSFVVKEDCTADLSVFASIESGDFIFELIDPKENVVYNVDGLDINNTENINLTSGTWYYRVVCANSENGQYRLNLS